MGTHINMQTHAGNGPGSTAQGYARAAIITRNRAS